MKRLAVMLAVVTAVLAFMIVPSSASSECWGDWCSGRDPVATGCANGARTVASAPVVQSAVSAEALGIGVSFGGGTVGRIELRWSDRCQTNWARLNLVTDALIISIAATQDSGYRQRYVFNRFSGMAYARPGVYYTAMIYSPCRHVRAHTEGRIQCPSVSTLWV